MIHPRYEELKAGQAMHQEKNDCTVIALAAATGCTYATAHSALAEAGRKHKKGLKDAQSIMAKIMEDMGFSVKPVTIESIQSKYKIKYSGKSVTPSQVRMFKEAWRNGKTYLCFSPSHALTIVNGEVIDWTDGRCQRIHSIYEVIGEKIVQEGCGSQLSFVF